MENALDYENLMSLCKSCHSIITQQENNKVKFSPVDLALKKFIFK
jgi:5-methylcytosine-specific restriction endonuclease McrA